MVGPEVEKTAQVRHVSRMFVDRGAASRVPFFTIVLRKGYGLGAQAMAGRHVPRAGVFTIAWPTGEFGAMGLEGAVKLGYRKELDAIADPDERKTAATRRWSPRYYDEGKAINAASYLEIDDVIDPADTRRWIIAGLTAAPPGERRGRKRPCIDPW